MIAHIAVLQNQLASANKTREVANAEEMNSNETQACGPVCIRSTLTLARRSNNDSWNSSMP
jgi:hypothetical protein